MASDLQQKESKRLAKALKDEGWKVFGSGKSAKESIEAHYKALEQSNGGFVPIEARAKARDLNVAIKKAQNHAARQYASMMETQVEGTTRVQSSSSSNEGASSETRLSTDFQSTTDHNVKSLKPSAVFYRTLADGVVEVRAFYIVDTSE